MKKEFRVGDKVEAEIESVAFGGDGVARVRDMVLFVPFTVDGDTAVVRITDVKKTFLRGKLEKLVTPSPWRVTPKCPYYLRCGGCQYQHIDYSHQLELKKNQVVESFRRIGKFPSPPARDIYPSPLAFGYRGKAEFHQADRRGHPPKMGFMDVTGLRIVDIERCEIMDETINDALADFRRDILTGRAAVESGGTRIFWSGLNRDPLQSGEESGGRKITRDVKGRELEVLSQGFFQANTVLVDKLVDTVCEMGALTGEENILDCYCGAGLFSLFLAEHARNVFAIEIDDDAVRAARSNFSRFGYPGALVFEGAVEDVLRGPLDNKRGTMDVILVDPPRTGCDKDVLVSLAEWKPKRLIYISCDPATQARDIRYLVDKGFLLQVLQPFDMFPQTKHIETIALLTGC
jgi:tRNA/tmRNA/rRNA uracil-C5-methylase (TrmA/RlmC/RlmD family)